MRSDVSISYALREDVLVFDGAMGTEIYRRNVFVNQCFDELCLSKPDMIREIHSQYCQAGAEVLTTNTFGANRLDLSKFGLGEKMHEINAAAVALARKIADSAPHRVFVAGSVGPVIASRPDQDDVPRLIAEQVKTLVEAGVDFILFETLPTRKAVEDCALGFVRAQVKLPYLVSVAVDENGESAAGEPVERMFSSLPENIPGPAAWGLNCGAGPESLLRIVERAVQLVDVPLVVQPNAGMPKELAHRHIYLCSPEYIATYAMRYVDLGVRGIGGCCGTTPDHVSEIARYIKPLTKKRFEVSTVASPETVQEKAAQPLAQRSRFASRLAAGEWMNAVEIMPPRGYDLSKIIESAKICHEHGVDVINIPDGPRASSRLSPLVTAAEIQRSAGIETILHFCCRDRNLIGMQADLFACAACGIRNILFVTGDPPKLGKYPFASGVFDADSIGLVRIQNLLNRGIDMGGQEITPQTLAVIGVGTDPNAIDLEREIRRLYEKVEAGANFIITQPVFEPEKLVRFLDRIKTIDVPVIAGIFPLASYRNATFMRNEVPGVVVPDWVMERMASVEGRDDQREMGIEIARDSVEKIRHRIAGLHVSAPFGNVHTALAVIAN